MSKTYALKRSDWLLLFTTGCFKFTVVGFYMISLMAMLKEMGYGLHQLSWVYLLAAAEAAKGVVSPLLERFRLPGGHFRGWLLLSTGVMALAVGILLWVDPKQQFAALLWLCALLSMMSLLFGCATLGLTCALLPFEERGNGGVIQVVGARLGKMLGGGLILWVYQHHGWHAAVAVMLAFCLLVLVQITAYRESTALRLSDRHYSLWQLFQRFIGFWRQPGVGYSWLLLLFVSCVPYSLVASTFVPMLNDSGWRTQNIGTLLAVVVPLACIAAAPLSGWLLKRCSRGRMIGGILTLQIFLIGSFCLIKQMMKLHPYAAAMPIILISLSYSILLPVVLAMLMDKADPKLATQDTSMQFTVVILGAYAAGFLALRMAGWWGYPVVYWLATAVAVLLAALGWQRMRVDKAVAERQ